MSSPEPDAVPEHNNDVLTLFAALWATAALFHAFGPSARATGIIHDFSAAGLGHVLLVVVALWVLAQPRWLAPLVGLAVLGPVTAWQEAPVLGNHWLVVSLVDLGLLLALAGSRRAGRLETRALAEGFFPVARWTLVAFYAFAAFAKLNHAFFDTTVSCSSVYFDETARTLGLSTPLAVGHGGWASLVPIVAAAIEMSIPILLCVRRTRALGVAVGLLFHAAIAIDQEHLFSDFSAVLSALFVLFLPAAFASSIVDVVRRRGRFLVGAWAALAAMTAIAQWTGGDATAERAFVDGRLWSWVLLDAAFVVAVGWWLSNPRGATLSRPLALERGAWWLAIVPVLVIANGVMPYLELKTAFGFTMYSNLQVADARSNHLLVPALALGKREAGLVRIEASDDPGLALYVSSNYLLPRDSLRSYLARHPAASIRYQSDGVEHDLAHASDDPDLTRAPALAVEKLLPLRAVDGRDPPRCQESFLPAL
ncbi:MAG: hypothetical protein ACR2LQ_00870 [Acidimicrobiales bacterium]